jgi:hypothetical protein
MYTGIRWWDSRASSSPVPWRVHVRASSDLVRRSGVRDLLSKPFSLVGCS